MNFKKLAALVATLASFSAFAAYHGIGDRTSTSPRVANMQEVLDRNFNPYFKSENMLKITGAVKVMAGWRSTDTKNSRFQPKSESRKHTSAIFMPQADLYFDAKLNDWTSAHMALSFHGWPIQSYENTQKMPYARSTLGPFWRDAASTYRNYRILDEAVVTFGNLERNPVFFRAGMGRVPFGNYERNNYPMSLVKTLTETQVIYSQLGFIEASGFNGSIYVFNGSMANPGKDQLHINNGGVSLGYCTGESNWGVDFVVDYMYNMAAALNAIHGGYQAKNSTNGWDGYDRVVGGIHAGVKGWYNEFDGNASFVTAIRQFGKGTIDIGPENRPAALHVEGGYSFPVADMNSRASISYQQSFDAMLENSSIVQGNAKADYSNALPKIRVQGNYVVDVFKNIKAGVHLVWDRPYKAGGQDRPHDAWTGLMSLEARIA